VRFVKLSWNDLSSSIEFFGKEQLSCEYSSMLQTAGTSINCVVVKRAKVSIKVERKPEACMLTS